MRHRVAGRNLGRRTAPRLALIKGLATELVKHGRITTTHARALEAQRLVERVITKGKKGALHDRRQVLSLLKDGLAVRKVFDELAPRYDSRAGGYTRIMRLLPRHGDAAPMAMLELV